MVKTIRVGLIGCGTQGEAQLAAFSAVAGVEIVAIADLDATRLRDVGDRFGIANRHQEGHSVLDHSLDLVSVCTMPDTHSDYVVAALERGFDVLCEKPLARNVAEALEMARAADRAKRKLMVGFNMRYMGATMAVREFTSQDLFGSLVCARGFMLADDVPWWGKHYVSRISGGGALNSSAIHMIDLLMWLAGHPKPLTATASMATIFPSKRAQGAPDGAADAYDVEDVVFGHVRFEGGFWLTIEGTWMNDRPGWNYSFDAMGTRGQAHLQPLELFTDRDGLPVRVETDVSVEPDFNGALQDEVADVVESVRTGRLSERLATGRQAVIAQGVVEALYRSAVIGAEVRLPTFR